MRGALVALAAGVVLATSAAIVLAPRPVLAPHPVTAPIRMTSAGQVFVDAVGCLGTSRTRGFGIEQMTADRVGRSTRVRFTLRNLPTITGPVSARFIWRDRAGTRGGVLTTAWTGPGSAATTSVFDGVTGRSRVVDAVPVIDRRSRSITTTYPVDLFRSWRESDRYRAEIRFGGSRSDWCATIGMKTPDRAFGRLHRP